MTQYEFIQLIASYYKQYLDSRNDNEKIQIVYGAIVVEAIASFRVYKNAKKDLKTLGANFRYLKDNALLYGNYIFYKKNEQFISNLINARNAAVHSDKPNNTFRKATVKPETLDVFLVKHMVEFMASDLSIKPSGSNGYSRAFKRKLVSLISEINVEDFSEQLAENGNNKVKKISFLFEKEERKSFTRYGNYTAVAILVLTLAYLIYSYNARKLSVADPAIAEVIDTSLNQNSEPDTVFTEQLQIVEERAVPKEEKIQIVRGVESIPEEPNNEGRTIIINGSELNGTQIINGNYSSTVNNINLDSTAQDSL